MGHLLISVNTSATPHHIAPSTQWAAHKLIKYNCSAMQPTPVLGNHIRSKQMPIATCCYVSECASTSLQPCSDLVTYPCSDETGNQSSSRQSSSIKFSATACTPDNSGSLHMPPPHPSTTLQSGTSHTLQYTSATHITSHARTLDHRFEFAIAPHPTLPSPRSSCTTAMTLSRAGRGEPYDKYRRCLTALPP